MRLMDEVDPGAVDAIVISHVHVDHCADLVAFFGYMAYGPSGVIPVPVYLPEGAKEPLAAFVQAEVEHVFNMVYDFHVVEEGDEVAVGDMTVRFARTHHPVPTLASRFEGGGRSLVYSGDTGPGGGLAALAAGADALLCEATLQGRRDPHDYEYHLTAEEAGALAADAAVAELILTHVSPTLDSSRSITEAAATFGRTPRLAVPGLTVDV